MKRDDIILKQLYEDIYKGDYLRSESDEFDWESFRLNPNSGSMSVSLLESFEKIGQNKTRDGEEDVFEITLKDGLVFYLHMNYVNSDTTKRLVDTNSISADKKGRNDIAELYDKFFVGDQYGEVCFIQFKDSDGRHRQTGEVGISAIELFATLRTAIIDSYSNRNFDNLKALIMRVDNNEHKRVVLYTNLLKRYMKDRFPNVFVDDFSEKDNNMTLVIAAK